MFENRNESENGSTYLVETLFADIHPLERYGFRHFLSRSLRLDSFKGFSKP